MADHLNKRVTVKIAKCTAKHVRPDGIIAECANVQGHAGAHTDGVGMWHSLNDPLKLHEALTPKGMGKTGRNRRTARRKARRRAEARVMKTGSWYLECNDARTEIGDTPEGRWWWSMCGHLDAEYLT